MSTYSSTRRSILKVSLATSAAVEDHLAVEEPLQINLAYANTGKTAEAKPLSITMRTPGQDAALSIGFLFTEAIISGYDDIESVHLHANAVTISLRENTPFDASKLDRNFYTTSSCGVCGKSSIDAIKTVCRLDLPTQDWTVPQEILHQLPEKLRESQAVFDQTGGLHAAALFDLAGNLLEVMEDVGRHNALDKVVGSACQRGMLPLDKHLLMLSGRASFELIQKAAMAGIRVVAAVGAPSSLAVELAAEFGLTLVGFLSSSRFNIYTGSEKIKML